MISLRPYVVPILREIAPLTGRLLHRPSVMFRYISASYGQGLISQQRLAHKPSLVRDRPRQGLNFDLQGKVYVITGGRRGLGLTLAEAIAQRVAKVHCFDRLVHPDPEFPVLQRGAAGAGGSLHYHHIEVRSRRVLDQTIANLVSRDGRIDGLVAAAGVQRAKAAIDYTAQEVSEVLDINYTGVFMFANVVA
ncbi:oxidoreductase, short chain dehydrogenase/reductase family [Aspergillus affinis]|uniref:oxidoreductase, short chain dehydrogenase/reductase family n=1 Tax=Aspergillus affinis TaxID=1070780 RepID=UPI0022FF335B|nr:oxidoreductase [Aspergillus affinis]KAI9041669.1 oxidoreductase [Aspergillus affinis]